MADVARMSAGEKIEAAMRRSLPRLGPEASVQVEAMLSPALRTATSPSRKLPARGLLLATLPSVVPSSPSTSWRSRGQRSPDE